MSRFFRPPFRPEINRTVLLFLNSYLNLSLRFGLLLWLFFGALMVSGQLTNERMVVIYPVRDTIQLDSLIIMPGTFHITHHDITLDPLLYTLDEIQAKLYIKDTLIADTLICTFSVFPYNVKKDYGNKPVSLINKTETGNFTPYVIGSNRTGQSIFDDKGLNKSGSISRGVLFGNNQNLSVNSTLNLQLSGKVSERFSILASVTDDNIPIQPDGNTQQLQDFDQVFIQIYDDRTKLIAGDFQLRKPTGYFLNYFKRAQGAYFLTSSKNSNGAKLTIEASASISKGRFARNVIQGIEGNQGPYRLNGSDGELFIIVLSGTEQIYIDGRLLQRGQDKDYVIDYNSSEVVFTPKQFITKDRRIVVEFQYSEKRYARPLLQSAILLEKENSKFFLNVYSENDAKNQPLQQDLSDSDKGILSASGDDFLSSVVSGIDSVGYSNTIVLYALTDSLGYDSVFVFSTDSAVAKYRVSFSFVGTGNGDYVENGFTSNGRKFLWVAPLVVNDVILHQGNYAPVIILAPPKKNQMLNAGMDIPLGRSAHSRLQVEGSISNKDLNTFSSVDSRDDVGFAFRSVYQWTNGMDESKLNKKEKLVEVQPSNILSANLSYEYTGQYFSQIERFREVEFTRNWNIQALKLSSDQHISSAQGGIKNAKFGSVNVGADMFILGQSYTGYKGRLQTNILTKGNFKAVVNASYLTTSGQLKSQFLRHKSSISKELGHAKIYFRDEHEHNLYFKGNSDTLASNTYQFYDWEAGLGTADTTKKSFTVYYRDRIDRKPLQLNLASAARADQYGVIIGLKGKKDSRLNLNISNRRLRVVNKELFTQAPENTLLARMEYSFKLKDGFIQNTTFYEIGSGLEQRRQFIYLEVPAGQGVYVWIDYDADNIKDLNEFETAQFGYEANYIRSFVQGNDYVKTFTNQFTQSLVLTPARILKKNTPIQKWISRLSDNATLRVDRKTTREDRNERYNPFINGIADSALLSINGLFRNILFFNKSNPTFGLDHTFQYGRNKNLLSNGFESRGDDFHQLGIRYNFVRELTFFLEGRIGKKVANSDFLAGRNYELQYYSIQPKLTWQPNNTSRLNITGQYAEKDNVLGTELVVIQKIGADVTLNTIEKGSFQAEFNFYSIRYNGESNNSLSFDMLEGLSNGYNLTWSAGVQRTVAKNLQINLIYNGRKPQNIKTIHAGGVQVRALF